jgi:putative peptidoglycan lipid II flippase
MARTTGLVSLAIMLSRVLGLIRDQIMAALFSPFLRDCFTVAFRTPNMLRDLFAEGALSTAFVTVFAQKMEKEDEGASWRLAHKVLSLTAVFMSLIALGGVLLAPIIVRVLTPGWPETKLGYTITLAQILYPFILLVSLAALIMGLLNAKKVFGAPALASSYFNIISVLGGVVLGCIFDAAWRTSIWDYLMKRPGAEVLPFADPNWGRTAMIWFCVGTLLGGLAQLVSQFPALKRIGYAFRFDYHWKDPDVRRMLQLMWPAVIAGSAVQINVLLNTIFASFLPEKDGPATWLGYAFRLMQLPLGVFGVAVATVTLPALSRAVTGGVGPKFREILSGGNRMIIFLTLPCAIGILILARPLVSLLFERGAFTPYETEATAAALRWYSGGLVFYACLKVLQPAYTAIGKRFIPMYVALGSVVLNASLNSFFVFYVKPAVHGHAYLALSTATVAVTNCCILYAVLTRLAGGLGTRELLQILLRLLPALISLAVLCLVGHFFLLEPERWKSYGLLLRLLTLGLTVGFAAVAYFIWAAKMGVPEAQQFTSMVRRRIKR